MRPSFTPPTRVLGPVLAILAFGACYPTASDYEDLDLCPSVRAVRLEPASPSLRVGEQLPLSAVALDARGEANLLCGASGWTSSNPGAATVAQDGTVTGMGAGVTWIRATVEGKRDSTLVTMSTAPVATVTIEPAAATLLVRQTRRLVAVARDAAGNVLPVRSVTWSSSTPAVGQVSPRGMVVTVGAGSTVVGATMEGMTAHATVSATRDAPSVRFLQIAPGVVHTCALVGGGAIPEGSAYCWGDGFLGQLGTGSVGQHEMPERVATTLTFRTISTGFDHTCASTASGDAYCWGSNAYGQLGESGVAPRSVPVRVPVPVALHGVVAGASSCGLAPGGAAWCWGRWADRGRSAPALLAGGYTFVQLVSSEQATCGLTTDGRVYCWGYFFSRTMSTPTLVSGAVRFTSIDVGQLTICGIGVDRAAYCWGLNSVGLWDAPTTRTEPGLIAGGTDIDSLAVAGSFVCAVSGPTTSCTGSVVDGVTGAPFTLKPVARGAEHRFASVSGGARHGCAIDVVGGGWCWGANEAQQVGVGPDWSTQRPLQLRIP